MLKSCDVHVQEVKHLKDQLKQAQSDMKVSVQCQLADEAHDLLMGKFLLS